MPTIIAGDIGGTSSRFMLYEVSPQEHLHQGSRPPGNLLFARVYANENVATFSLQVSAFLKDAGAVGPPEAACIAVAGPIFDNKVTMTNRSWVIDGNELQELFNIPTVRLVNDFVAAGYGLLTLDIEEECLTLQVGKRKPGGPIACIGSGTGLGETFLTCPVEGDCYDAWPTEGGHAEMAPRDDLEYEFIKFMKETKRISRVSVERVVSGTGLVNVYEFLCKKFPERVDKYVNSEIEAAGDQKGKIISLNADKPGSICEQVMKTWATHYGAEAGVVGLRLIPDGGLFLAGGMTPKNLGYLQGYESPFMKAFYDKGRVSEILRTIPIYAVLTEDIGLRGAHFVAFRIFENRNQAEEKRPRRNRSSLVWSISGITVVAALAVIGAAIARVKSR